MYVVLFKVVIPLKSFLTAQIETSRVLGIFSKMKLRVTEKKKLASRISNILRRDTFRIVIISARASDGGYNNLKTVFNDEGSLRV